MSAEKRIIIAILAMFGVVCAGVTGYHFIEGWMFLDSLYMTMITIFSVGFHEVHDLSPAGRVFTMGLIVLGTGSVFFVVGSVAEYFIELRFAELLRRKRMEKSLQKLESHYIICGYGRIGKEVARELMKRGMSVVVIENSADEIKNLETEAFPFIAGDAADEEVLRKAGIQSAKGLVCATASDANNVFIALTARGLNQSLFIVARCIHQQAEPKLKQAGADVVISPYVAGGKRLAMAMLKPNVLEFFDGILHGGEDGVEMGIEEIRVTQNTPFKNKTIRDSHIHKESGVLVIGIKKGGGKFIVNPPADAVLEDGDRLIIIGKNADLARCEKTF